MASDGIKVPGVYVTDEGGARWKLRWREAGPDGRVTAKSPFRAMRMEGTALEVHAQAVRIAQDVKRTGHYRPEAAPVAELPRGPANLADGIEAFIAARESARKFRGKTPTTYRSYRLRVVQNLHAVTGIPGNQPLPVTVLTRDNFVKLQRRDENLKASALMRYAPLNMLLNAWRWMADDPDAWPEVPPPPASPRDYLPRTPKYSRTIAPSIEHVDACLRHLPAKTTEAVRMFAVFSRFTGLRGSTIMAIDRSWIDLPNRLLHIPSEDDKNEYARAIPLADALLDEARGWIEEHPGRLFPKRAHSRARTDTPKKAPGETLTEAWEAATAAGEVPRHVWAPPNRKNKRPDHGIRAAFDSFLMGQTNDPEVVDYLVGRNEGSVRGVHYGSAEWIEKCRHVVNLIPPIDRDGPKAKAADSNLVQFRRRG
jgi:integrase